MRVLLLDPESEVFKQREEKEEGIENNKSGRLKAEYITSVAFCKDIIRLSGNRDSLELRAYSETPNAALLIADPKKDSGIIHINDYTSEFIRGYVGTHRYSKKNLQTDIFLQWLKKYEVLWDSAKKVALDKTL